SVISPSRSGDSKRVVSGSDDETVRVWLVETGELAFEPIKCHGQVSRVRYSPDGERIASGAVSVQIWDAQTGNGILSIKDSPIFSLSWTPDSDQIISGYFGEIIKWNSRTGDQIWRRKTPQDNTALSLSLNGTHLATCDWSDKSAILYDVTAGEHLTAFQHDEGIQDIVYSSSGQFLATVSNDKKVYVWVAPPLEDPQDKKAVSCIAFSPDEKKLISGSWDATLIKWDLEIGLQISEPWKRHTDTVWAVDVSRNGRMVVSGSDDRTVIIWSMSLRVTSTMCDQCSFHMTRSRVPWRSLVCSLFS
ncbi:WD40 repeat-like protein, partial [Gyrodon lividus]